MRWASLRSDALSAPRPVAPDPGRGGETEACAAARGASGSGVTCLRVLVQEARAAGSLGGCGCFPRNTAGAVVGPSTSWMSSCFSFPSSFLYPLPAWEALLPPTPAGLPATSANPSDFTDIPVGTPGHIPLVQLLLTFSHCFWEGGSPEVLLLRQWQRTLESGGQVEVVPVTIPAGALGCWFLLGGRGRCPSRSQDSSSSGLMDGGVGGSHVPSDRKEKYRKLRDVRLDPVK